MNKTVLITGASRGLGRALALELIALGYNVAATARNEKALEDLAPGNNQVLKIKLDVTVPKQIENAVEQTVKYFGRIDIIVNNAGYGYFGAVEESDEQDIRKMFETDFWGVSLVTRAVLPILRKQRSGHIVNITSVGGITTFPAFGYYHAAKFAVEGLSQSLAKEVAPLNIHVTLVEPGAFRTDWSGSSAVDRKIRISDYDDTAGKFLQASHASVNEKPGNPALAAKLIVKAIASENPPLHLIVGSDGVKAITQQLQDIQNDLDTWKVDSSHTAFGDEEYWANLNKQIK
jgi:NAD(P)-dependent dehydrogenase (short-subunit alcohol dehydrogenase family)